MCAANDSSCAATPVRRRCGSSRARSRRRRAPAGSTRRAARSRRAPSSSSPVAASRGASLGWSATPATIASYCVGGLDRPPRARAGRSRSARSAATPTPAAGSSASSASSQSSPSAMSRWQWVSTTGAGSGSGAGGRRAGRAARPPTCRVGPSRRRRRSRSRLGLLDSRGNSGVALGQRRARPAAGPSARRPATRWSASGPSASSAPSDVPQRGGRLRHHRVVQHGDRAQRLGGGVEDRRRAARGPASTSSLATFHGSCSVT